MTGCEASSIGSAALRRAKINHASFRRSTLLCCLPPTYPLGRGRNRSSDRSLSNVPTTAPPIDLSHVAETAPAPQAADSVQGSAQVDLSACLLPTTMAELVLPDCDPWSSYPDTVLAVHPARSPGWIASVVERLSESPLVDSEMLGPNGESRRSPGAPAKVRQRLGQRSAIGDRRALSLSLILSLFPPPRSFAHFPPHTLSRSATQCRLTGPLHRLHPLCRLLAAPLLCLHIPPHPCRTFVRIRVHLAGCHRAQLDQAWRRLSGRGSPEAGSHRAQNEGGRELESRRVQVRTRGGVNSNLTGYR